METAIWCLGFGVCCLLFVSTMPGDCCVRAWGSGFRIQFDFFCMGGLFAGGDYKCTQHRFCFEKVTWSC